MPNLIFGTHSSYAEVVKGPARRLQGSPRALEVEDVLVNALLADIEVGGAKDALPLLAFTLERLYAEYHAGGHLELAHYDALGRVKGSIEAGVERAFNAADADPAVPKDRVGGASIGETLLFQFINLAKAMYLSVVGLVNSFSVVPPANKKSQD